MSNTDLVIRLFLQLIFILTASRIITYIGKRYFRQTTVVCEMIAGILLGPSFFGMLFPQFQSWVFPTAPLLLANGQTIPNPSMSILFAISQIGLVLYMFMIGLEFNTKEIKKNFKQASAVSLSGILVPFTLGVIVAFGLSNEYDLFYAEISPPFQAAFLGACLSITAFPMMARILEESKTNKTRLGTLALAAGSIDDVIAWIMVAVLLTFIQGKVEIALFALIGTLIFLTAMMIMMRSLKSIQRLLSSAPGNKRFEFNQSFTAMLIMLMACAWFTDYVGIYAVFGAFVAGIAMPRGAFTELARIRIDNVTTSFLLPAFFVFSGLSTQVKLINTVELWVVAFIILIAAIIGKGVACALAARVTGTNWQDALTIGTLMNARGLMELIILNIGLQAHIITLTLFTIMVFMTIVTNLMTSPLYYYFQSKAEPKAC